MPASPLVNAQKAYAKQKREKANEAAVSHPNATSSPTHPAPPPHTSRLDLHPAY